MAQNSLLWYGPQCRTLLSQQKLLQIRCEWLRIHVHMAVYYPCAGCHVSMCMWSCIHIPAAMYPHAHVSMCAWPCIHCRIWECTVSHGAESLTIVQNHAILKASASFIGKIRPKNWACTNYTTQGRQCMKSSHALRKCGSASWAFANNKIQIRISRWILSQILNGFRLWNRCPDGVFWWKKNQRSKNLVRLSLSAKQIQKAPL
jgi:hypothetical protein